MKRKPKKKLSLSSETLRVLDDSTTLAQVAGAATAGRECSGEYTSCGSQWPNCNFTSTCPQFTADDWCTGKCV